MDIDNLPPTSSEFPSVESSSTVPNNIPPSISPAGILFSTTTNTILDAIPPSVSSAGVLFSTSGLIDMSLAELLVAPPQTLFNMPSPTKTERGNRGRLHYLKNNPIYGKTDEDQKKLDATDEKDERLFEEGYESFMNSHHQAEFHLAYFRSYYDAVEHGREVERASAFEKSMEYKAMKPELMKQLKEASDDNWFKTKFLKSFSATTYGNWTEVAPPNSIPIDAQWKENSTLYLRKVAHNITSFSTAGLTMRYYMGLTYLGIQHGCEIEGISFKKYVDGIADAHSEIKTYKHASVYDLTRFAKLVSINSNLLTSSCSWTEIRDHLAYLEDHSDEWKSLSVSSP